MAEMCSNDSTLMFAVDPSLTVDPVFGRSSNKSIRKRFCQQTKCSFNLKDSVKDLHVIIPPKTVDLAEQTLQKNVPNKPSFASFPLNFAMFQTSLWLHVTSLKRDSFIFRETLTCSLSELIYSVPRGRAGSNQRETLKQGEGKQGLPICQGDLPKSLSSLCTCFAS